MEKRIEEAMNRQINMEYESAYLYLAMSLDAETKGMTGLSQWMFIQWLEELDHARILQKYMLSRGARIDLFSINVVEQKSWKNAFDMIKDSLEHERNVTKSINGLMKMAKELDDFATCSRLQWFVDEQVEEEESMRDVLGMLIMVSDCKASLLQYDRWLGERKYLQKSA
ncbi:MAG: ferritin [Prevotellaceae bacterium]|nr:ferritin [Candidatus Colivivens equi]MCQ2076435.1 ferritin [Bacteroidaceae bacterium]